MEPRENIFFDYVRYGFGINNAAEWLSRSQISLNVLVQIAEREVHKVINGIYWLIEHIRMQLKLARSYADTYKYRRQSMSPSMKIFGFKLLQ